jgi:hypothetical protein
LNTKQKEKTFSLLSKKIGILEDMNSNWSNGRTPWEIRLRLRPRLRKTDKLKKPKRPNKPEKPK